MAKVTDHPTTAARDIVSRAEKAVGPMWDRLSPAGRMVECRAILCIDMLRSRSPTDDREWWLFVNARIINIVLPGE
jgi:hypothetical protein